MPIALPYAQILSKIVLIFFKVISANIPLNSFLHLLFLSTESHSHSCPHTWSLVATGDSSLRLFPVFLLFSIELFSLTSTITQLKPSTLALFAISRLSSVISSWSWDTSDTGKIKLWCHCADGFSLVCSGSFGFLSQNFPYIFMITE